MVIHNSFRVLKRLWATPTAIFTPDFILADDKRNFEHLSSSFMQILVGLLSILLLAGCRPKDSLKVEVKLPKRINECSGMTTLDGKTLWVIEDGGNKDVLYPFQIGQRHLLPLKKYLLG